MPEHDQIELWISEARHGDRLALAKLLMVYHPHLRARAVERMEPSVQVRGNPDDILQEVYLDVAREIDRFEDRGPGSFLGWVCAILEHKVVDARRAAHYQVRDVDREVPALIPAGGSYWNLLDAVYLDSATPSRAARREEALSALHVGLANLSELHRRVLELRFLEGQPVSEVAARLAKTEGAVVAMTRRALDALRIVMDGLGEFTHGI
ncbi:MAG TPA: RNA polymerase sigma factor [Phycisphaerae bacterium]|nr:RNA polymerase sigma factor [Phycisphaerae bacterium]